MSTKRVFRRYVDPADVFLPIYSPDLNPVEEACSKLKNLLKYRYRNLVHQNLDFGILHGLDDIMPDDLQGYFRHVGYLNI